LTFRQNITPASIINHVYPEEEFSIEFNKCEQVLNALSTKNLSKCTKIKKCKKIRNKFELLYNKIKLMKYYTIEHKKTSLQYTEILKMTMPNIFSIINKKYSAEVLIRFCNYNLYCYYKENELSSIPTHG